VKAAWLIVPFIGALLPVPARAAEWTPHPSDGVTMQLTREGGANRLDFDFHGHAGYAIAHRTVELDLPANFQFVQRIRGNTSPQNLELKLIDSSGDNVWWLNRRNFVFPRQWSALQTKKRQISFAWGPRGGGELAHAAAMEIVVTAGSGGKGSVWFTDPVLEELPPTPTEPVRFDSGTIDFGVRRELGGLAIEWPSAPPGHFTVTLDGGTPKRHAGGRFVWLPDAEARVIHVSGSPKRVTVEPPSWAPTENDFVAIIARDARRGEYPRYFLGEQSYWTVAGADGAEPEALVGEDGNVEPFKGGFSIEPFLHVGGKRLTWADVTISHSLIDGDLPIPSVTWTVADRRLSPSPVTMTLTAAVSASSMLQLRYRIEGDTRLELQVRPYQVNPSTQFLNAVGGLTTIDEQLVRRIRWRTPPAQRAAHTVLYKRAEQIDVDIPLLPGAKREPLAHIVDDWREKLHRVAFDIPAAPELGDTIRTSIAYMLVQRDGPALEPGSRSYDRAWIRDGALMAATLLRLGHADAAKDFAEWFAGHQYANGKVPCCVDSRGADPVPENDSHGELIYLVAEVWRLTGDDAFVRRLWPHVAAAARYIDELRAQNHGAFEGLVTESISHEGYSAKPMHSYWDDLFALRGLDDAAMLAGVICHPGTAGVAGTTPDACDSRGTLETSASSMRRDLAGSIRRTIDEHHLDYVPGSAELGDFDATSTAIGISPLNLTAVFPAAALQATFDRYLSSLQKPREDYTPYEMRSIGALIRLGRRDDALPLIDRFLADRRPAAWNEWAEVVRTDARKPGFIGDMPHAWVASDFVRSMLDAVAYDAEEGRLVIGAGVPRAWLTKPMHVGPLPVEGGGVVDLRMRGDADTVTIDVAGTARPRSLTIHSPDARSIRQVWVDGQVVTHGEREVTLTAVPARVVFGY
jgi:hypothetical protein